MTGMKYFLVAAVSFLVLPSLAGYLTWLLVKLHQN